MKASKTITKLYILSLLIFFANFSMAQKTADNKWIAYKNSKLNFAISFPAKYEESKKKKDNGVLTYIVKTKFENKTFNISANLHTHDVENKKGLLEKEFNNFASKLKGSVENKTTFKCGNHKGLKGNITTAKGAKINYLIVMAEKKQYQLYVVALKKFADSKLVDKFFQSLKINKQ